MTSTAHSPAKQVKDAIDSSRAAEAPPSELSATFKKILAPLASLKITIVLFLFSLFLILAGTLAQVDYGIWTVMETYFRTWVAHIELQIFMPNEWAKSLGLLTAKGESTTVPFPGGYPLGFAMVINLLAAHAVRFKLIAHGERLKVGLIGTVIGLAMLIFAVLASTKIVWPLKAPIQFGPAIALSIVAILGLLYPSHLLYGKRLGIVYMHVGVILLLVNELVTGLGAYEGRMEIQQQGINNFTYNLEESELAIIALNPDGSERVVAIPESKLEWSAKGNVISDERLPFDVKVEKFFKNSRLVRAVKEDGTPARDNPADAGELRKVYVAESVKVGTGADGQGVADIGSGYVTLYYRESTEKIGTYLFSSFFTHTIGAEEMEPVVVDGKTYSVNMRFAREYKPYSVHLIEFRHDKFTGTQKARNFSSEIMLLDEDHPNGRLAKISMNDPLRYRGETFFQAAFLPRDSGTILQVVRNPGYLIPYIACIVVSLGMALHFLGHLDRFSKRLFQ